MADKLFDNDKELKKLAEQVLNKKVAPIMKRILKKHILEDVYNSYTPIEHGWVNHKTYQRRHVLEKNIVTEMIDPFTIGVTSSALAGFAVAGVFVDRQMGSLLELIEADKHGLWRGGFPRYPIKNTQKELDQSPEIEKAIQEGFDSYFS